MEAHFAEQLAAVLVLDLLADFGCEELLRATGASFGRILFLHPLLKKLQFARLLIGLTQLRTSRIASLEPNCVEDWHARSVELAAFRIARAQRRQLAILLGGRSPAHLRNHSPLGCEKLVLKLHCRMTLSRCVEVLLQMWELLLTLEVHKRGYRLVRHDRQTGIEVVQRAVELNVPNRNCDIVGKHGARSRFGGRLKRDNLLDLNL